MSLLKCDSMSLKDAEKAAINKALVHTMGNKKKAAVLLEIDRRTLYRKLDEYFPDWRAAKVSAATKLAAREPELDEVANG